MKALSIKQPWAWLIAQGYKDVENRTWKTNYRGKFLIHASKSFDRVGYEYLRECDFCETMNIPKPKDYYSGGIIGIAEIVDCVTEYDSFWFQGPYGFLVENAKPVEFHQCRGKLHFFDISEALECKLRQEDCDITIRPLSERMDEYLQNCSENFVKLITENIRVDKLPLSRATEATRRMSIGDDKGAWRVLRWD